MAPVFELYFAAVEKVRQRLMRATAALDAAGVAYAVIGGNAVAAWVAEKDPAAVRTTRDVDMMVRREDRDAVVTAMEAAGFITHVVRRFLIFTEPDAPNRRNGVRVMFSGERVQPSYSHETPDVAAALTTPDGYRVLDLESLLIMKLTSLRDRDRTHMRDLLSVGGITGEWSHRLPPGLRGRFDAIVGTPEEPDWTDE